MKIENVKSKIWYMFVKFKTLIWINLISQKDNFVKFEKIK